ncbi:MAG: 4Fe-4S dicluster domain-containing protein [Bryobacter sp.]|nr:4Fe-4S dicluster domain-containing protein [Bryobacter sp.]
MSLVQITNPQAANRNAPQRVALDQLHHEPDFQNWLDEGPQRVKTSEVLDPASRRDALKLLAAGAGIAATVSCRRPVQKVVSFSKGVEDLIPGKPLYYNTVMNLGGVAQGLRIEANDGRPTKAEGNPLHPTSLGAANGYAQGSIMGLYDPDRCQTVMKDQAPSNWTAFGEFVKTAFPATATGAGLAILAERNAGPSWRATWETAKKKWPAAIFTEYEPLASDCATLGVEIATGTKADTYYKFDQADIILSLDYDFLGAEGLTVQPVKHFSKKRRVEKAGDPMNRLYVVEAAYSVTGGMADHRLRLKPSEVGGFAAEVLKLVQTEGEIKLEGEGRKKYAAAVAADLKKAGAKALVCAGPRQLPEVHALALALNAALGSVGTTVEFHPSLYEPQFTGLEKLKAALSAGQVQTLVILGGNPAYTMHADFNFAANAKKAKTIIHLGLEHDETAALANWCLPQAHYLEAWGDGRTIGGTASLQQPVIAPLYGGKTPSEVLSLLLGEGKSAYDITKGYWTQTFAGDKEKAWRKALHDGVLEGTGFTPLKLTVDTKKVAALNLPSASTGLEIAFLPSPGLYDGRFANNAMLLEAPDPMTKVVWDNCVTMSSATAKQLGVEMGYLGDAGGKISVSVNGATIEAAALIVPGQADGVLAITLGYGREKVGRFGKGAGFNAYPLRTSAAPGYATGVTATKANGTYLLVRTNDDPESDTQHGRPIAQEATLQQFTEAPSFAQHVHGPPVESLFPDWDYSKGNQWGMAIDLNSCIGCNACLIACFQENNISMVGKDAVNRGREMHWIRLDRYFSDMGDEPTVVIQPVNCQQCENAPCESVCPVAATVHSPEGLNDMAYNRCIGTRYCMNNCPYKVRRFNYLNYQKNRTQVEMLGANPDVSTRMRGVMEKCTYCTQRISEAKINAKTDPAGRREVRDGEVKTACQQTCPADAITFGNVADPNSEVAKAKANSRNYALLAELNVRPRTTYLARIRNTNPALVPHKALEGHGGHAEGDHAAGDHKAGDRKAGDHKAGDHKEAPHKEAEAKH